MLLVHLLGSFFMFSNLYQSDFQNKTHVTLMLIESQTAPDLVMVIGSACASIS